MNRFLIAAGAAAASAALVAPMLPAAAATTSTSAATVAVTAGKPSEFRFTLSVKTVKRGRVVFKVKNSGTISHDFQVFGKKTPLLAPGKSATITVVFKKPGKYPYRCTVSGHAAAGMKGILKVT